MTNDLRAEIRFKNAILWNALQKRFGVMAEDIHGHMQGRPAVMQTASLAMGVSDALLSGLLNLTCSPVFSKRRNDGKQFRPGPLLIAEYLEIPAEELFPLSLYKLNLPKILIREFSSPEILSLQEARNQIAALPAPDDRNIETERQEAIETALSLLSPQHADIIRQRFGIGNDEHTLREVGDQYHVSPERMRQIEANALRLLRHPSRSDPLREVWS
jgi:RNA polymerase sigma factor (sigma-70 family)